MLWGEKVGESIKRIRQGTHKDACNFNFDQQHLNKKEITVLLF